MRCMTSARLTALATTSITTSSGRGSGSGTSDQRRFSGPPGAVSVIARTGAAYGPGAVAVSPGNAPFARFTSRSTGRW
jgi:chitodextrinase